MLSLHYILKVVLNMDGAASSFSDKTDLCRLSDSGRVSFKLFCKQKVMLICGYAKKYHLIGAGKLNVTACVDFYYNDFFLLPY